MILRLYHLSCFLGLCVVSGFGQSAGTFPEYTSEKISEVRNEFAKEARFEEGLKYLRAWQTSQGLPMTFDDSVGWYSIHDALAKTFFDLRQLDSAEIVLTPVLHVSAQRFPKQYLQIQNSWGIRLVYGGRFSEAKKHYIHFRALLDAKEVPATPDQYCNVVLNLGVTHSQLGDTDAALEVFHHIEDVIRENSFVDKRLQATLQFNLAGAYAALGQDERSLQHSRKAFAINLETLGLDHPQTAQTLNAVANGMKQNGDLEGALETYYKVLDIFQRLDRLEHPLRAITLLNVAETLEDLGRPDEALPYITSCIEIRKRAYGLKHSQVARAYKAQGTILSRLDRFDEAVASLDTALLALGYDSRSENPYSGVDAMFNLFYTLDHRADIFYDRILADPSETNLIEAREAYVQGINVLNDLRVHFKGKLAKGNLNNKSYSFYEPAIDVCLKLYETSGEAQHLEQAMQWSSESKGNDFYDLIRGENAMISAHVPDSIRSRDDLFQEKLAELESQWYESREDAQKHSLARRALDDAKRQYRDWLTTIENRYPAYYNLLHADVSFDIQQRQAQLSESSGQLIEYFLGDSNAVAFVMTPKTLHVVRLTSSDSIVDAVEQWREQIASPTSEASHMLSQLIWQPLIPFLSSYTHLVIIADGILSTVPFEILEDLAGNPALNSYAMSYGYASRNDQMRSVRNRNSKWLGFAPVYEFDGGSMAMASRGLDTAAVRLRDEAWMKLPGAESEVMAIGDLTRGEKRIGKHATERFFRAMAGEFGILHLSMHAWTDDDEPLLSTLIFAEDEADTVHDGRLYAHEIFQLNLPAKLVVLSACNTGVGAFRRGEGISSLARAFMYAGTEATVMSLWKVPDESTSKIMQAFYKHLRAGEPKDEALRNAKRDYLNAVSEPELKKPYHWAGFVLMGDPSPVYTSIVPTGIVGLVGGMLLLGGMLWWMQRQKAAVRAKSTTAP